MVPDIQPLTKGWKSDDHKIRPAAVLMYPYFSVMRDTLQVASRNTQSISQKIQLLIMKSYREMVFQRVHFNKRASYTGYEKP